MLNKIMIHLHVTDEEIVKNCNSWDDALAHFVLSQKMPDELKKVHPIFDCNSEGTRKKNGPVWYYNGDDFEYL